MLTSKAYLGDSVYAEYDGQREGFVLTTEYGDGHATNTIYLEPEVLVALLRWLKAIGIQLEKV